MTRLNITSNHRQYREISHSFSHDDDFDLVGYTIVWVLEDRRGKVLARYEKPEDNIWTDNIEVFTVDEENHGVLVKIPEEINENLGQHYHQLWFNVPGAGWIPQYNRSNYNVTRALDYEEE